MRHVKEDHWGRALCFFLNQQKARPRTSNPRTSSAAADARARTCMPTPRSQTCVTTKRSFYPEPLRRSKSRARPRSSPPGTPRRQAPARGRPRRRRERRLRLGLDVLRHRDKGVEVGAVDVVRRAHQCGLDDLRTRCVDARGARARTRRGDGLGPRDEFVYASRPAASAKRAPTAICRGRPSRARNAPPRGSADKGRS